MSFEFKDRRGRLLHTAPSARSLRAALVDAVAQGVDLAGVNLERVRSDPGSMAGANLRRAKLGGAYLSEFDLSGADLSNADLSGIHGRTVGLRDADLRNANFRKADLTFAQMQSADLREADLREADLRGAKLFNATLDNALLTGARINALTERRGASFAGANMSSREVWAKQGMSWVGTLIAFVVVLLIFAYVVAPIIF